MSDLTLKPVLYANRRLTNEEIDAIVGRPKAEPEACPHGVTDGNCKECYEDGCDHCNSPLYVATKCRVCGRVTEPVQKPCTYKCETWPECECAKPWQSVPPQRKPLSEEEIKRIDDNTHFHESSDWSLRFARAIERAHGIGGQP